MWLCDNVKRNLLPISTHGFFLGFSQFAQWHIFRSNYTHTGVQGVKQIGHVKDRYGVHKGLLINVCFSIPFHHRIVCFFILVVFMCISEIQSTPWCVLLSDYLSIVSFPHWRFLTEAVHSMIDIPSFICISLRSLRFNSLSGVSMGEVVTWRPCVIFGTDVGWSWGSMWKKRGRLDLDELERNGAEKGWLKSAMLEFILVPNRWVEHPLNLKVSMSEGGDTRT
jgi:hypothetical protein